ncbi:MAG: ATP-grasp domain-containing protein [Polyangiales bacterium]
MPASRVLSSVTELYSLHEVMPFPIVVKGPYYGAKVAHTVADAVAAFHKMVAEWGYPVIVQEFVAGQELCVLAVGDGDGGLVGAVQMRKTVITDTGKGWAGVAIHDPRLSALAETFMRATKWRGPCELEVIRTASGEYFVLEVNPRFPAWCFLSAGAGMNLPYAVAELAAGRALTPLTDYRVGTMFVRIALDQISDMEAFSRMSTSGEVVRSEGSLR